VALFRAVNETKHFDVSVEAFSHRVDDDDSGGDHGMEERCEGNVLSIP